MENKVYYGEYSLQHWINLLLKGNILLPWYQRSFVWEKKNIERLIKTLENNEFVPPVIIGAVKKNGEWKNYILDGQQRLTTILFASCNRYIDKKDYISKNPSTEIEVPADDLTDDESTIKDKLMKWNFYEIIKNKQLNCEELKKPYYKQLLDDKKDSSFFEKHFLGFAYIKPSNKVEEEKQSRFYSEIFRNINTGGEKLTRYEARKSLYFLKENLKLFFLPEYLNNYKVETSSKESGLIDFIKYLSILSQYKGNNLILNQYGGRNWEKNEKYYGEYISAIVDDDNNNDLKFDISYPGESFNDEQDSRISKLKDALSQLDIPKSFTSIKIWICIFLGS